jgi:hypothetical protein
MKTSRFSKGTYVNYSAMPVLPNGSGLRDNYSRGNVADFLREKIRDGS